MNKVLNLLKGFEDECVDSSIKFIFAADEEFNRATEKYDLLLEHTYRYSCCYWGCHGQSHKLEYLCGRVVSHTISANRLVLTGYYDESLSLIRSSGEIANLLWLFWKDETAGKDWYIANEQERRKLFSPAAVRQRLKGALKSLIPFGRGHYQRLCHRVVHPTPETRPNAAGPESRPILGAYFQPEMFTEASWELYWSLATVAAPITKLANMSDDTRNRMVDLAVPLFEESSLHVLREDDQIHLPAD